MKKIEAIIQPYKLQDAKEALKSIGIAGLTISEVRGQGRQKGQTEVYRGMEYDVDLLPKVKIEVVVLDARCDEVVAALTRAARTGKIRDGKVSVLDVVDAIRIRNDDLGEADFTILRRWRRAVNRDRMDCGTDILPTALSEYILAWRDRFLSSS
jgi:nitrogen regulatory protein P-II 1